MCVGTHYEEIMCVGNTYVCVATYVETVCV